MVGDRPGHGGRAVHRGKDTHIVARGDPAIGPHDAHEGVIVGRLHTPGIDAKGVVASKVAHGQVVHVHMLARCDGLAGEADDLAIAAQRLADSQVARSDLVPGGDGLANGDAFVQQQPFGQCLAGNQHVIERVESDHGVGSVFAACCCNELHDNHLK
ncbi:hypothetical protein D3C79_854280 [compost metagenome]